jgi:hypothetical protein
MRERFIFWRGAVGDDIVKKTIISNSLPLTKFIEWANLTRANTYYSNVPNSSKTAKYRKKTNTQRTKERSSYIRASEFGGTRVESVISQARGEMSKKTINELTSAFFHPTGGDFDVPEFNEFDVLTQGILGKFGSGQLPKDAYKKYKAAARKLWEGVERDMARDGY